MTKEYQEGENNWNWRGDNVSIRGIHKWLRHNYPHPNKCEECGKITDNLDLMNLDHKYRRNIEDYIYACRSCHLKYDYKMGFRKGFHVKKK